nr:CoA ester lyase [Rhodococcus sp. HNM0569]
MFCPADRPERFAKAAAAADVVVLDLEDGVGEQHKADARNALVSAPLDPDRTVVRVNAVDSPHHGDDLRALADTPYRRVMLPKCESAGHVASLGRYDILALVESPLGALAAADIARADATVGMMWGAEDLVAALGGTSSRTASGRYRDVARHVRSTVLLAAKAHGRLALDSVYLDIPDTRGLAAEADDAGAVGFDVKVAIHPTQVAVIRAAFAPAADEVGWARRVLDAAAAERGVFAFEGKMVDSPVLRHAEQLVRRADRAAP